MLEDGQLESSSKEAYGTACAHTASHRWSREQKSEFTPQPRTPSTTPLQQWEGPKRETE